MTFHVHSDEATKLQKKGIPTYYLPFFRELASGLINQNNVDATKEQIRQLLAESRSTYKQRLARAFGIHGRGEAWRYVMYSLFKTHSVNHLMKYSPGCMT